MSLTEHRISYKPFQYDWAYEKWELQQQLHWLPKEVALADDVYDWGHKLAPEEKNLLTHIFRFFTQADICVCDGYLEKYLQIFKPTEIRMMLTAFANMETVHIAAYSHLLDTVGMPEVEYSAFMKYAQMKEKYEYMQGFSMNNSKEIAKTLAGFGAFQEGLSLFASFAMLLNFPRFGKMKGMGQIVTWSIRDETLHCDSIIQLFKTYCKEQQKELDGKRKDGADRKIFLDDKLKQDIVDIAIATVEHEDAFIDLSFEMGGVEGMTAADIKQYIRYIADRRLIQLGVSKGYFKVKKNPLLWLEETLNTVEHTNFFETRSTEYQKAATTGNWEDAFKIHTEKKD